MASTTVSVWIVLPVDCVLLHKVVLCSHRAVSHKYLFVFYCFGHEEQKTLRASRENKINALLPKRNREGGCDSSRCLTLLHLLKHVCVFIFITTESVTSIYTLNSSNFIIFLCCKPAVWWGRSCWSTAVLVFRRLTWSPWRCVRRWDVRMW